MTWVGGPPLLHLLQGYQTNLWVDIDGNGPGKGIYISDLREFNAKLR